MKDSAFELEMNENESYKAFDFIKFLKRFFSYWPWFLISLFLAFVAAFLYMRYAPITYASSATIKIIDDSKETDIAKDPLAMVWSDSKINLENEIAVLKSYRLLSQVVDSLHLNIAYYNVGNIKTSETWEVPFVVRETIKRDSLTRPLSFYVSLDVAGFKIVDENESAFEVPYFNQNFYESELPFSITLLDEIKVSDYKNQKFLVMLYPFKESVLNLNQSLVVQPFNKKSDILSLWMFGESPLKSETVLNTVVDAFNQDGIRDRQMVSKRTLEFIDERFGYLTEELDSIEGGKQAFKIQNNLSYIEADANSSLTRKSETEDEVTSLETQVSLAGVLKQTVINQAEFSLLPVNIGLENGNLNALVANYNEMALEREKLMASVGASHPTLISISTQLERAKVNIIKTVNVYQAQLRTSLTRLNQQKNKASSIFSDLPEKEKRLRAIERQQSIKENLFLLLLQKREEAAINLAVTSPSIKVVDFGLTAIKPVSPKRIMVYGIAGLLGLFLPFVLLYIKFTVDTKIRLRQEVLDAAPNIPFLAEIPHFKNQKLFKGVNDRSFLAESFRILATNINYMLPRSAKGSGNVIYVTSAVTEEGKSLLAYNLSIAYASVNKKVLLVGADLRNPALHKYFNMGIKTAGLTDYLLNPTIDWKEFVFPGLDKNPQHRICLSGAIPPNAPQLLSGEAFEHFIASAKETFDIIIVDTAPIMPVTDTLLIADHADVTLFVTRAGFTEKEMLQEAKELNRKDKLKNMAFVLNDVKFGTNGAYKYGYAAKK